jgi:hypothetical protein
MSDSALPETPKTFFRYILSYWWIPALVGLERVLDEHWGQAIGCWAVALLLASIDYWLFIRKEHWKRFMAIAGLVIGFVIFSVSAIALYRMRAESPSPTAATQNDVAPKEPRSQVSEAQFKELTKLSDFIGKDENELRETFDVAGILRKNIGVQSIRINLRKAGQYNTFFYNQYTEGDGSWIWLAMEGKYHMTPSGPHSDDGPHDVVYLVTTIRYQFAQREIAAYLNSPLITDSIKLPLTEYKKLVDIDFELMIRTLNKYLNAGDDYFLRSQEYGGPFYAVINNDYFSNFQQLKPKASQVMQEISKQLLTNLGRSANSAISSKLQT